MDFSDEDLDELEQRRWGYPKPEPVAPKEKPKEIVIRHTLSIDWWPPILVAVLIFLCSLCLNH